MSKSKKGRKILVFTGIIVVVAGLTAAAVLRKREPVFTVQTEKVTRRNLTELVVANGRIQPVVQVKISPEVSGEIIELPVKEGQAVNKGDLLVKIKARLLHRQPQPGRGELQILCRRPDNGRSQPRKSRISSSSATKSYLSAS